MDISWCTVLRSTTVLWLSQVGHPSLEIRSTITARLLEKLAEIKGTVFCRRSNHRVIGTAESWGICRDAALNLPGQLGEGMSSWTSSQPSRGGHNSLVSRGSIHCLFPTLPSAPPEQSQELCVAKPWRQFSFPPSPQWARTVTKSSMRERSCREADDICPLQIPTKTRPVGVWHFRTHQRLHESHTVQRYVLVPHCCNAGGIFSWPAQTQHHPQHCLQQRRAAGSQFHFHSGSSARFSPSPQT